LETIAQLAAAKRENEPSSSVPHVLSVWLWP
jgi:hypothetical protein